MSEKQPLERFLEKFEIDESCGCWVWTANIAGKGYGRMALNGKDYYAHRFSYETYVGEIPDGLVIDHLCRNRLCVNPDHLEPVTNKENLLRGDTIIARCAKATHCPRGHEYSSRNTRVDKRGKRACRACDREYQRLARLRRRRMNVGETA